jgi:hypothetical protein
MRRSAIGPPINDYTAFEECPQNGKSIWSYLPGENSAERARARAFALMRDVNAALGVMVHE